MLRTNPRRSFAVALAIWSCVATAKTDPQCLQHLGGGFSDAECYSGLSNDLVASSKQLYGKLRATIPTGNVHIKLLDDYMTAQDGAVKFCNLQRNAGANWKTEHDGSMFPAIYEQCIYEFLKAQNEFLKNALEMANWK
jgi:hypothetical protein